MQTIEIPPKQTSAPSRASTSPSFSPDYDPAKVFEKLQADDRWRSARCPERHAALDHFADCPGWNNAFEAVKASTGTGFLFTLIGPRGTGKTQLSVATIRHAVYDLGRTALFCEAIEFFTSIKSTYRRAAQLDERQVMNDYQRPQLLVVDEITVRSETKWEDDLFFSVLNKRYNARKDTILLGNLSPKELHEKLGGSIASRMEETGGVIDCNWKSFRSR